MFTLASALCGMATSLNMLIAARVLQGLAGGGLQPSSQAILLDAFPPEKQGQAMTVFGVAALLAPVVGPTLGGYITDNYGWRWIFYLNVPVGLFALAMCSALVSDPEYLKNQRAAMRKQHAAFDTLGLRLLSLAMVAWEVLLSKGQEWDWFGDPFWRVQTLTAIFVVGLVRAGGARNGHRESADQFSHAGRSQLSRLLRDHFLRVWRVVCQHDDAARHAAVAVWLRCDDVGPGAFAGGMFAVIMLFIVGALLARGDGRAVPDGGGLARDGGGELLDVAIESGHQPVAGGLAAGGDHCGAVDDLCAAQRGGVYVYSEGTARCGRRIAGAVAK